jgi:hypothetical protein
LLKEERRHGFLVPAFFTEYLEQRISRSPTGHLEEWIVWTDTMVEMRQQLARKPPLVVENRQEKDLFNPKGEDYYLAPMFRIVST